METLSDNIQEDEYSSPYLFTDDVREFIKQLKDDIHLNISTSPLVDEIIDELAGEKLI